MNFNPGYTWKKELSLWWAKAHPTVIQILVSTAQATAQVSGLA
jgi:hypothetical protein